MAILPIRTFPDPVLRDVCSQAEPGTDYIRKLADNMIETMYNAPGIGLAAPQVGESIRMVVVNITGPTGDGVPHVFLNPEIVHSEGSISFEEGCLSFPELTVEIERAKVVQVHFQDLEGTPTILEAEDLLAVAIQHELDHIEGHVIMDYASSVRRDLYRRKVRKILAQEA
ncbi:MAG: peptide deformylase [Deltaproteobacteria bacterium]|nr:peptide deformylase [Deltaproteobacteria bacterium]